jgi:hypothetical protein
MQQSVVEGMLYAASLSLVPEDFFNQRTESNVPCPRLCG